MKSFIWLLLFAGLVTQAQENIFNKQLVLQIDNDVFVPQEEDNYYTSGLFFRYQFFTPKFLWFQSETENNLLVHTALNQQMYTPIYPNSNYIENYDRPFAGWLSLETGVVSFRNTKNIWGYGLEIGVTGKHSLGKQLHRGYHNVVGIEEKPLWLQQIPSEVMVNVGVDYLYNITGGLYAKTRVVAGTKDISVQPGVLLVVNGRYKDVVMPVDRKKIFAQLGVYYKYVGYDALIEGSVWNNNAPLTKQAMPNVFLVDVGLNFVYNRFTLSFSYNYATKATAKAHYHLYGSLKLGYRL